MPGQDDTTTVLAQLSAAGATRGSLVGLEIAPNGVVGVAFGETRWTIVADDPGAGVAWLDTQLRPRWAWWNSDTARRLVGRGARVATAWDVAAVHRLLRGGWKAEPPRVWAHLHGLDPRSAPAMGQLDLLGGVGASGRADSGGLDGASAPDGDGGDADDPVRPDRHLRPEWASGGWYEYPDRVARWAQTALRAAQLQADALAGLRAAGDVAGDPLATARSESAAELLCTELEADGLPIDVAAAEALIGSLVGPRPRNEQEAAATRAERDAAVLQHLPPGSGIDLRSPADVKNLLRRLGIDVPDTRAWRLEQMRDVHPVIDALLHWRKAERVATTYGYGWLDANVADGRLRGAWGGSDGAAGRMTAQAGLHNLPAELRPVVVAEPGHVFVRADLGQIEPRVLAAVSGDAGLRRATQDDDLYAPVAKRLGVERSVAKVAVLAAMYGQTSGTAGQALRGLEAGYPVAMKYLADAARCGVAGTDLRTYGGRLIRMWPIGEDRDQQAVAAGRGRYARNAMVQGAAAELFKVWAVTVRARGAAADARIVLCLHDELLLHVPDANADAAVQLLHDCLGEAAFRWQPRDAGVRFVADVSVVRSWADAKG